MAENERFDEAVNRWLEEAAPARLPERVLNATFERTRTTRQHVGWRALLGRLSMPRFMPALGSAVVVVVVAALALNYVVNQPGFGGQPSPSPSPSAAPSVDLGIFEPVAGRIVYFENSNLWAVDPNASSPTSTLVRLEVEVEGTPLGWSSDGTKLLFLRADPNPPDRQPPFENLLYILHADGTETQVTPGPVRNAAISPDGSRVAFSTRDVPGRISRLPEGLYVVDAEGGEPVRIAEEGTSPTFSPDGTQIAYLSSPPGLTVYGVTGTAPVWVVNVDGTDAHEIRTDEPGVANVDFKQIKWSPAGDRIAMYRRVDGQEETGAIYTFAPDGSDFTVVITGGFNHHWSPDGSQIAYSCLSEDSCTLAIADADGSNVRTLDLGSSGPWHPRTLP